MTSMPAACGRLQLYVTSPQGDITRFPLLRHILSMPSDLTENLVTSAGFPTARLPDQGEWRHGGWRFVGSRPRDLFIDSTKESGRRRSRKWWPSFNGPTKWPPASAWIKGLDILGPSITAEVRGRATFLLHRRLSTPSRGSESGCCSTGPARSPSNFYSRRASSTLLHTS
jgi:hypothetical protein